MSPAPRNPQSATLTYVLAPDAAASDALRQTIDEYGTMLAILNDLAGSAGSNVVTLHSLAYEAVRTRTRLPARLVTLGLRDFAARRSNGDVPGVPLDEKLYAIKSPSEVSISTVLGRIVVPFDVAGYAEGWKGALPARLVLDRDTFELRIGVTPRFPTEEKTMVHEGILARMGRVIAGVAFAAVDKAEAANQIAVIEQAIREIDAAAEETRAELGKARAEEHRIGSRRDEITADVAALENKIRTALESNRDDLAKAGVARQIDLESQIEALDKALADVTERIDEGHKAMQAVLAARRDAEARLAEYKRSEQSHQAAGGAGARRSSPDLAVARASAAVTRMTGVPSTPPGDADLDELERLHRERAISERLARFKARG
jgi:phage shock protein A